MAALQTQMLFLLSTDLTRSYNRVSRSKYSDKAVLFTCFFKISQKITEKPRIWQPCWQILATLQSQMFFRLSTDITLRLL